MRSLLSIQVNCFPSLVLSWRRNLRQESLRARTKDDKFAVDASLHPNGEKQYFCVRRLEARRKGIEILLFPRVLLSFPSKKIANYKTKSNSLKVLRGNNMLRKLKENLIEKLDNALRRGEEGGGGVLLNSS